MPEPGDVDPDDLVERAEQTDAGAPDDADGDDRKTMDYDCHNCGTALTPNYGLSAPGRRERTGLCPNCRLDGIGSATFVTLTGYGSIRTTERILKRQRTATAQSTQAAAAFLGPLEPLGDYAIRRTDPLAVTITWADDVDMGFHARRRLTQRLRAADVWYVQSYPDRIRLVDRTFADAEDDVVSSVQTIRGP